MNDVISQWVNGEFEEVFYATYIIIVPKYQLGTLACVWHTAVPNVDPSESEATPHENYNVSTFEAVIMLQVIGTASFIFTAVLAVASLVASVLCLILTIHMIYSLK